MKKKVLITGSTGFLAKHVKDLLNSNEYDIIGLVKSSSKIDGFSKIYTSIFDLVDGEGEFDFIYHLASFIPVELNSSNSQLVESNINLTSILFQNFGTARIIFSSSVAVYGHPDNLPITIESPFNNPSLYGLSKLAGEAIIRNHPSFGVIRFSSIIGPQMNPNRFVAKVVEGAKNGNILVFGDGSRKQNYIDVRDAARVCLHVAHLKENVILFGVSEESVSNFEVARIASHLTGASIEFKGSDNSPSFIFNADEDFERYKYSPQIPIRETLEHMLRV